MPAAANAALRWFRSKSCAPNSSSNSLMARDKSSYSICKRSAARVKCSSSAKATKKCKCLSSIYAPEMSVCYRVTIVNALRRCRSMLRPSNST